MCWEMRGVAPHRAWEISFRRRAFSVAASGCNAARRAGCSSQRPAPPRSDRALQWPRSETEETMTRIQNALVCAVALALSVALARPASAAPEGQLTFAVHVSL